MHIHIKIVYLPIWWLFSLNFISLSSLISSDATIIKFEKSLFNWIPILLNISLDYFESSTRSPLSSLIPIGTWLASIRAAATHKKLGTPEFKVLNESTKHRNLFG